MKNNILNEIKEQLGIELQLCDYFKGLKELNGKKYFNVLLKDRISESLEYAKLKQYSKKHNTIKLEANGLNRLAIFIN